MKREKFMFN